MSAIQQIDLSQSLDLSARFLKVSCPISMVGNTKQIRNISEKIEMDMGATIGKAVKSGKWLYDPDALKPVCTARNACYTKHRELTSVWNDSSWRLLPTAKWFDYAGAINPLISAFDTAVNDLAWRFNDLVDDAKIRLGGLFDRNDYPADSSEFKACFKIEILQEPLPTIQDASRVSLPVEELKAMQRNMERAYANNIAKVQEENCNRLITVAQSLRDSLKRLDAGEQKSIHGTLLESVEKACAYAEQFNIDNNAHVSDLITEVRDSLTRYSMDEIRESKGIRWEVQRSADQMVRKVAERKSRLANLAGYMG